jgi:hypothetical protein
MGFRIKSTTETIGSVGGMVLVGQIAKACGLHRALEPTTFFHDVLLSLYGLLVQGRTTFEEITLFQGDRLFKKALGIGKVPKSDVFRLYLERLVGRTKDAVFAKVRDANLALIGKTTLKPVVTAAGKYIPVDVDVSVFNNSKSHKEGVSRTYMGVDGYAPIISYIGGEGYMLDCELRPGSQHCQKGTPDFLARNLLYLKRLPLNHPVLFRLDGGNDAYDTIKPLVKSGHFFIIKRNLRRDNPDYWVDVAQTLGKATCPREGKRVYTGMLTLAHPKAEAGMPELDTVFQVTIRTIDKEGNALVFPDIEVESWWTNMYESAETVIALYHDHGTSEQFHSELKTDMNVERLPSGKRAVNSLILTVAMLAFNTLRLIGQKALAAKGLMPVKTDAERKRLRKVIDDLIRIGCKLTNHGRVLYLCIWEKDPWLPVFRDLHRSFEAL